MGIRPLRLMARRLQVGLTPGSMIRVAVAVDRLVFLVVRGPDVGQLRCELGDRLLDL